MGVWRENRTKRIQKLKKFHKKQKFMHEQLQMHASDILQSHNFQSTKAHIQHGSMTVNRHSINVAKCSLTISNTLRIPCHQREMVRGALLHDYFLYDWHDKDRVRIHNLHGFRHPGIALANASKEYKLTLRERDIIKKHMWPLTIVPPACREAWIVSAADKYCSFLETIGVHKGGSGKKDGRKYVGCKAVKGVRRGQFI